MQDDTAKRWDDSLISLGLGALVVVVSGILIYNYFSGQTPDLLKKTQQANNSASPSAQVAQQPTSSPVAQSGSQNPTLPAKHTVVAGESFWKLSEKYYGTGYEWKKIVAANKMEGKALNPGMTIEIPKNEMISATSTEKSPSPTQIAQAKSTETPKSSPSAKATTKPSESAIAQASATPKSSATALAQASTAPTGTPAAVAQNNGQKLDQPPANDSVTYTVVKGDSLWKIAADKCGDGYKWTSISKQNKLVNPGVIHTGNTFTFTCSG
jgi:nucleoid-associated protein YgaU